MHLSLSVPLLFHIDLGISNSMSIPILWMSAWVEAHISLTLLVSICLGNSLCLRMIVAFSSTLVEVFC